MDIDVRPSDEVVRARLKAAAELIPIIESGLANSKLDTGRAALMSEFCLWAAQADLRENRENEAVAQRVLAGLDRIKSLLSH